jgi:predicted ester cyclase
MTENEIFALHRRWIDDLWHAHVDDLEKVAREILAPDFVGRWPEVDIHGPDKLADWLRGGLVVYTNPKMRLDIGPVVNGEYSAGRWTFSGEYAGGIPGATVALGTLVEFSGMEFLRCADGRIAEYWVSSNEVDSHRQLGFDVAGCFEMGVVEPGA